MNETSDVYNAPSQPARCDAAQALRQGGADEIRQALQTVRLLTLDLARRYEDALGPALAVPLRDTLNPPLWELGHVAWFQQWWIERNPQRTRGHRADPTVARLPSDLPSADLWYDSSTVAHERRWALPLPSLQATLGWLESTQAQTLARLAQLPDYADDEALYFFRLACLHEAMHVEAAAYMAVALGILPTPETLPCGASDVRLHVPGQTWAAGWPGGGFAFDNEVPACAVRVEAFEIDAQPVSWNRFASFVADGGYRQPRWWSEDGWAWRSRERPQAPSFPTGDGAAVQLSAYEADAWCRWAGRRLPTEFEWECAALGQPGFAWGCVWEWTASPFEPYPGFTPHPYLDYSQPWFGSRRVLRGASRATPACMAHPRYRNFYPPGRYDIFAGFRSCAGSRGRAGL